MSTTLIKGGTVVNATGTATADVLVDGETIAAVFAPGALGDVEQGCDRVVDAAGRYVIPGGVDVHTHMELPFGGTSASDTFETGTQAAAWGGTTTIVDFAVQRYGERRSARIALCSRLLRHHSGTKSVSPPSSSARRRAIRVHPTG